MGVCAVSDCKNAHRKKKKMCGISFFAFPREKKLCDKWVKFCRRVDSFNTTTSRICSHHFSQDDISNNIKFEMGFAHARKLKPGAFPTIKSKTMKDTPASKRAARQLQKENKAIVEKLLQEYIENTNSVKTNDANAVIENGAPPVIANQIQSILEVELVDVDALAIKTEVLEDHNYFDQIDSEQNEDPLDFATELDVLKKRVEKMKNDNFILMNRNEECEKKICTLEIELMKCRYEKNNLESKLADVFSQGQIRKIKGGNKRIAWSEQDINKAFALYSSSSQTYKHLQEQNYPLPSVRTLQFWAQKMNTVIPELPVIVE